MFLKFFFGLMLFCSSLIYSVHPAIFASESFALLKMGTRAVSGITTTFPQTSLLECAVLCSRSGSCNAFQHLRSDSMCELLDPGISLDDLETEDGSCNIYNNNKLVDSDYEILASETPATTEMDSTTSLVSAMVATTDELPNDRNPALICANYSTEMPVVNCTCSTPDDYCSGSLQCTTVIYGKTIKYYVDQTYGVDGRDQAANTCLYFGMELTAIKTLKEQVTICTILSQAVGTQARKAFYIGLRSKPPESGDSVESVEDPPPENWYFDDKSPLIFSSWASPKYYGPCASIIGYDNNRFNWKKDLCTNESDEVHVDRYGICSRTSD